MTIALLTSLLMVVAAPQQCPEHARHASAPAGAPSPYAGEQDRAVKALSEADMQAYLQGTGMGMAKAAELNGYPGPRHLLDNADALKLSAGQRSAIDAAYRRMKAAAVPLGRQIVEVEKQLDALFARGRASEAVVERLTREAARLQGLLRAVHLEAHLAVRSVLTPEQIEQYGKLRGYGS
jgi:Spy/CpxP family protein refolding chaperone